MDPICVDITETIPSPEAPMDVTSWFEARNLHHAITNILHALDEYLSTFSKTYDVSTAFCSNGYYWICIGDVSLSSTLRANIRKTFTSPSPILFKNWEKMKEAYPEITKSNKLDGTAPAFVGLPLPTAEEDS